MTHLDEWHDSYCESKMDQRPDKEEQNKQ